MEVRSSCKRRNFGRGETRKTSGTIFNIELEPRKIFSDSNTARKCARYRGFSVCSKEQSRTFKFGVLKRSGKNATEEQKVGKRLKYRRSSTLYKWTNYTRFSLLDCTHVSPTIPNKHQFYNLRLTWIPDNPLKQLAALLSKHSFLLKSLLFWHILAVAVGVDYKDTHTEPTNHPPIAQNK